VCAEVIEASRTGSRWTPCCTTAKMIAATLKMDWPGCGACVFDGFDRFDVGNRA
jgi:hypothetical protein